MHPDNSASFFWQPGSSNVIVTLSVAPGVYFSPSLTIIRNNKLLKGNVENVERQSPSEFVTRYIIRWEIVFRWYYFHVFWILIYLTVLWCKELPFPSHAFWLGRPNLCLQRGERTTENLYNEINPVVQEEEQNCGTLIKTKTWLAESSYSGGGSIFH